MFVNKTLQKLETIVITKSVKEILFDGYDDILLKIAVDLNMTQLPSEKFAWFYGVSNN
jgi:scavenger receptor class B protein 1